MSSLQRYKKSGGFFQLLSLIETFGPQKKEKFIEMIEAESLVWGRALREKMLSLERIFKWPDAYIVEVFKTLPAKNLTYALQGLQEDQKTRLLVFFSASEKRKMEQVLSEGTPKPEEISATLVKVIEIARKMLQSGELRAEKLQDDGLSIPEEFESKLESGAHASAHAPAASAPDASQAVKEASQALAASSAANGGGTQETAQLQRTLTMVIKENKSLKDEVHFLRDKLEQIRRIA